MNGTGVASFDEAMAALHAALPGVTDELDVAAGSQVAAMLRGFAGFVSAVEATRLRLVEAAERTNAHRTVGARDTAGLVADLCGQRPAAARRDADTAARLAVRPRVAEGLAGGVLSAAKAAALARLDDEAAAAEEAALVARARSQSVRQVEAAVEAANLRHRAGPPPPVSFEATITNEVERVRIAAVLPPIDGMFVEAAWVAAAEDLDLPKDLPFTERLARGAVACARWYLGNRPEKGSHPMRSRTVVGVVVDHDTLASGVGAGHTFDGTPLEADDVRRLACDAGISRIVTDPQSLIVDIGKTSRSIPAGLATFLAVDDQACRWPGCASPGWACEGHHVVPWSDLGETNSDNVALLCWFHHHLIHCETGWELSLTRGERTLTVRRHGTLIGQTRPPGLLQRRHAAEQRRRRRRRRGRSASPQAAPPRSLGSEARGDQPSLDLSSHAA